MRPIDYFFSKNVYRLLLRLKALPSYTREDITVVIAVKDRHDDILSHAFKSIRSQDYPGDLIKLVLVDYDSIKTLAPRYEILCKNYNAKYIRIDSKPVWNKSHALNIAIKQAKTKYVLSTDADIVFQSNYFKVAISALRRNLHQVVLSKCLDLPEMDITNHTFNELVKLASYRFQGSYLSSGINMALTHYYQIIHGYDEHYASWGSEDDDLIKRFKLLGLTVGNIGNYSSYVHVWHPKVEGSVDVKQLHSNSEYLKGTHSIVRNPGGWGGTDNVPSRE